MKRRVIVIDNYDSFTYNLVQYIGEVVKDIEVVRNDQATVEEIAAMGGSHLLISPGPGDPDDAGISKEAIRQLSGKLPILGVCLGHQCMGEVFGGKVVRADTLMHGKTSMITHDGSTLFQGLPNPFEATRYHSLAVEKKSFPGKVLRITAETDGIIMGLQHRKHPTFGVQFHPESVLTHKGRKIIRNFLSVKA